MDHDIENVNKGFAFGMTLLIIYLAIFGLDIKLTVIWLVSIPTIFIVLFVYDWWAGKEMFSRGASIDFYISLGGPVTIISCIFAIILMLRNVSNEEHEESDSEETNGDTRHDEHTEIRREQKD